MENLAQILAQELGQKQQYIENVIALLDEGNTIPFIARYRKEMHGTMDDTTLRNLEVRLNYLRNLAQRKEEVKKSIEGQEKLTEELAAQIDAALTLAEVEDLYRPYKQKRRTRATVAKEKGLEPLALYILEQTATEDVLIEATKYISDTEGKEVPTAEDALQGAKDILAEKVSDEADYRTYIRDFTMTEGTIKSVAKDAEAKSVYENYYDFEEKLSKIAGHRVLALNRGENEKFLSVKVVAPDERIVSYLQKQLIKEDNPFTSPVLEEVAQDAYDRLIAPAIEREIRNELTERAEDGAITVFGKNLEMLLMQPPVAGKVVLGWDPAFRTGATICMRPSIAPTPLAR